MRKNLGRSVLLVSAVSLALAATSAAATPGQLGATCNAAWSGKRGTATYREYKKSCVKAAVAATQAAQTAGNSDDDAADLARAAAACRASSPPPRRSKAARAALRACVSAASNAQKAYGGRPLGATLAGDATTDPDGSGSASLTVNQGHGQLCYDVRWSGLGVVSGLDVHAVADDSVVSALNSDADLTDGAATGCVTGIAKDVAKALRQHPEQYYVSIRTDEFPAGAIRGTLHT